MAERSVDSPMIDEESELKKLRGKEEEKKKFKEKGRVFGDT